MGGRHGNGGYHRGRGYGRGGPGNYGRGNRGRRGGRGYQTCQSFSGRGSCFICGSFDHFADSCPHRGGGGSHGGAHGGFNNGGNNHNHHTHPTPAPFGSTSRSNNSFHNHDPIPSQPILNQPINLAGCNFSTTQTPFHELHPCDYLADSAATTHISNQLNHFINYTPLPSSRTDSVMTGAGALPVLGYGSIRIQDDHGTPYQMHHVMYVPRSPVNLFSTIKLNQEGGEFLTTPSHAYLRTNQTTLTTSRAFQGIYLLSLCPPCTPEFHAAAQVGHQTTVKTTPTGATLEQWHSRFGHVGLRSIISMVTSNLVHGLHVIGSMMHKITCMPCILGKFTKQPYPDQQPPTVPLELVHSDLCGALPPGLNGHKYFCTVRDRFSGYTMVKTLHDKSEASEFIMHAISYLENHNPHNLTVKNIRLDKGGEYTSQALVSWLEKKGIRVQYTGTECHQSNGTAEMVNRTIMNRVRATLIESNQPRLLWPWIVGHVTTAMNFIPYSARPHTTPHETMFNTKPDVSFLRPFGCKVAAFIPTQSLPDKLCARGVEGRLVGYIPDSTSMYQVSYLTIGVICPA